MQHSQRGQSLMEILIAVGIAGVILTSIASLMNTALISLRVSREKAFAETLLQDMASGVRSLVAQDWHSFWGSDGLVSYWALDEATGTTAYEPVSGNGGTLTSASQWLAGSNCRVGRCLSFDGAGQYVDIASSGSMDVSNISVSAWLYSGVTTANLAAVSRYDNVSPVNGNWILGHGLASNYAFTVRIGASNYTAQSGTGFSTGAWHHVVGTYDGSYVRLYVDGTQRATTTISGSLASNTVNMRIGNVVGNTNYWNGRVDDVRVYNRALTLSEIQAIYNNPGKLYPQNIGGFWNIKEGVQSVSGRQAIYSRWFTIGAVQRDFSSSATSSPPIVSSGGLDDPSTKLINYVVTWRNRTLSASEYVSRTATKVTVQTDWSGGAISSPSPVAVPGSQFATSSNINYSSTTGAIRLKLTSE